MDITQISTASGEVIPFTRKNPKRTFSRRELTRMIEEYGAANQQMATLLMRQDKAQRFAAHVVCELINNIEKSLLVLPGQKSTKAGLLRVLEIIAGREEAPMAVVNCHCCDTAMEVLAVEDPALKLCLCGKCSRRISLTQDYVCSLDDKARVEFLGKYKCRTIEDLAHLKSEALPPFELKKGGAL